MDAERSRMGAKRSRKRKRFPGSARYESTKMSAGNAGRLLLPGSSAAPGCAGISVREPMRKLCLMSAPVFSFPARELRLFLLLFFRVEASSAAPGFLFPASLPLRHKKVKSFPKVFDDFPKGAIYIVKDIKGKCGRRKR